MSGVKPVDGSGGLLVQGRVEGRSQYFFAERASDAEWQAAARRLASSGFAVIDHFLGAVLALRLRDQALQHYRQQPSAFITGAVGGGHDGDGATYRHASVRGDRMTILASDGLPLLSHLCGEFDSLLAALVRHGGAACDELRAVDKRSSPMFAVYPAGGARYMRHTDNPDGNGRVLTCLYYLNPGWRAADGGELSLLRPSDDEVAETERARVAPLLDRCVVFWSDARVPHEVLPSHAERLALSVWFHAPGPAGGLAQAAAAQRAVARAAAATEDDKAAWARAKRIAEGAPAERGRQQQAEDGYSAAIRTAASTLRARRHVQLRASDATLLAALAEPRRALPTGTSRAMRWAETAAVEGKMRILLHQLAPASNLAAGCTQLLLLRCSGDDVVWMPKPAGAKALVLTPLTQIARDPEGDVAGVVSVHARRCALLHDGGALAGWPRASADKPVVLDSAALGTMHFFDCADVPLHVRLQGEADVAGVWSFGAVAGGSDGSIEELVAKKQAEAGLVVE